MTLQIFLGIMIPFFGTTLGAACVAVSRKRAAEDVLRGAQAGDAGAGSMQKSGGTTENSRIQRVLLGFAAGVMTAASVWSLLLPALDLSKGKRVPEFFPAAAGFALGVLFLLLLDHLIPHLHMNEKKPEGPHSHLGRLSMLTLAVTLHNVPEGMAAGVVFAAALAGEGGVGIMDAFALAVGIAIQNFPEGAIISLPMRSAGGSRKKAFLCGMLSGIVEPVAAVLTLLISGLIVPVLPYLLAFAAGAMLYVVVEELVPESVSGGSSDYGTVGFSVGFLIMMVLDVMLG